MTKGLDEILSGEEPAQVEQSSAPAPEPVAPTPEPQAQPNPAEPNAPEPNAEDRQPGMVPQKALHASRERARTAEERAADLERQVAELNGKVQGFMAQPKLPPAPPPEPPKRVDFWEDPDKFVEAALSPMQQQLAETRYELSFSRAVTTFGEDAMRAADTAMKEAITRGEVDGEKLKAQLIASRDPVGDVVRWYQNSPAVREQSLRETIKAELMAEMGTQPSPQPEPSNPTPSVMPSNLVGQRNVGTRSGPAWSGPAPINDIFDRARSKKAG